MSDCICPHEQDIGILKSKMKQYDREFRGNGREGIIPRFIVVEKSVEDIEDDMSGQAESIDKLATAFSALAKNDSNKEAVRKVLAKAIIISAAIIGAAGTLVTIIYTVGGR